jgi:hypothetical protein
MSGGHFEYIQYQVEQALDEYAGDKQVQEDFPRLAVMFKKLRRNLGCILNDIDWHISSDSEIEDKKGFERDAIMAIRNSTKNLRGGKNVDNK